MKQELELLPPAVRREAVHLGAYGVDDWAIPAAAGLQASELFARNGLAILGGDFWTRTSAGSYVPLGEVWGMDWKGSETWKDYVSNSLNRAKAVIEANLRASGTDGLYITLEASSEHEYDRLRHNSLE